MLMTTMPLYSHRKGCWKTNLKLMMKSLKEPPLQAIRWRHQEYSVSGALVLTWARM